MTVEHDDRICANCEHYIPGDAIGGGMKTRTMCTLYDRDTMPWQTCREWSDRNVFIRTLAGRPHWVDVT